MCKQFRQFSLHHLSQVLTRNGCFSEYLNRFGKTESDCCALCWAAPDGAEHAVFQCDAFHQWRPKPAST
ncbi:Reverse transcriptase domain-containing protein [Aphis craccivora]|uniref:Reverse transcriptase domain-containing protein n=1 Tax=Aphis craccivora TaxID=307492 RepID=A0A6G0ZFA3_APHCR|nr:Reverse transcriptase domain-containing protein [Aphis craccivora]